MGCLAGRTDCSGDDVMTKNYDPLALYAVRNEVTSDEWRLSTPSEKEGVIDVLCSFMEEFGIEKVLTRARGWFPYEALDAAATAARKLEETA